MSLVTRCPACETAFKVVRDQLRISDGWVRCGRCSQVFDANLQLKTQDAATPALATARPAQAPPSVAPEANTAQHPLPAASAASVAPAVSKRTAVDAGDRPRSSAVGPDPASAGAPASSTAPEALALLLRSEAPRATAVEPAAAAPKPSPAVARLAPVIVETASVLATQGPLPKDSAPGADTPVADRVATVDEDAASAQSRKVLRRKRVEAVREARALLRAESPSAQAAPAVPTPGRVSPPVPVSSASLSAPSEPNAAGVAQAELLRRASPEPELPVPAPASVAAPPALPSFLDTPAARTAEPASWPNGHLLWIGLSVLALLLLVAQVLRQGRDDLAAAHPGLRPLLVGLCRVSGCELSALRRIDAIRIEGSAFTPQRDGAGYQLIFTLRNSGSAPLAMPAIELSLLDGNERPLVRRVFQPAEFGAPAVLVARGERTATLGLSLKTPAGNALPPVVGYSLLAFYP